MKKRIVFIALLLFSAILEATIFPFNLVLLAVLSWGVLRSPKSGLVWAFMAGLVLDLVTGETLGLSSLIFLLVIGLLNLYKTKFKAANLIYLLPFTFFSACLFNLLKDEPFNIFNVIITTILLLLVWPVAILLGGQKDEENLQLPLKL